MQSQVLSAVVINWNKSGYTIVASYSSTKNFEYEKKLLDAVKNLSTVEDEKISFICDRFLVHVLVGELLFYACLTPIQHSPTELKKITIFAQSFLNRVRNVYRELPLLADLTQELKHFFTTDLSAPLEQLSINHGQQQLNSLPIVQSELAEVRKVLIDSVQKLIDRSQKLDQLVKKTQSLEIMVHKDFLVSSRSTKTKKNLFFAVTISIIMLSSTLVFGILFYIEYI